MERESPSSPFSPGYHETKVWHATLRLSVNGTKQNKIFPKVVFNEIPAYVTAIESLVDIPDNAGNLNLDPMMDASFSRPNV